MINFDFSKFDFSDAHGIADACVYVIEETYRYTCGAGWYTLYGNADGCLKEGVDLSKYHGLMLQEYSNDKKAKFKAAFKRLNDAETKLYQDTEAESLEIHALPAGTEKLRLERLMKRFEFEKKFAYRHAEIFDNFYKEIENIIKECQ